VVNLWDVQTGSLIKSFDGAEGRVTAISISAEILAAGTDGSLIFWLIPTGDLLAVESLGDAIRALRFRDKKLHVITAAGRMKANPIMSFDVRRWIPATTSALYICRMAFGTTLGARNDLPTTERCRHGFCGLS